MAIRDTSNETQNQYQAPANSSPKLSNRSALSFSRLKSSNRVFGSPISSNSGSEYINKLMKVLKEVYDKEAEKSSFITNLIALDNTNVTALNFSCIVVCERLKDNPSKLVAAHTLILEATGDKLTPYTKNYMGQQVTIDLVPADAFNRPLVKYITEELARQFGSIPFKLSDACVVPRDFNIDNADAIQKIAYNAGTACGTDIEVSLDDFYDTTPLDENGDPLKLLVEVISNDDHKLDDVSQPIRSDGLIELRIPGQTTNNQNSGILNLGDTSVTISTLSVFPDLVYAPADNGYNSWQRTNQQAPTQSFGARLVISDMASRFAYTPATVLFMVWTALSLRDNNNWYQFYRPRAVSPNEINLKDIGVLNIECNITGKAEGERIPTHAADFTLVDLGYILQAMIVPGLVISVDVPRCSAMTWFTSIFDVAASNEGKAANGAYDVIYKSANHLTLGNFSKYFPKGTEMFVDPGNIIHAGYYTDKQNRKRDIRDFDYLAIFNIFGERNPAVVGEWSDSFFRTDISIEQRLRDRWNILKTVSNDNAVLTGYYHRVTFSTKFLNALSRGMTDTGVTANVITPMSQNDFTNRRGSARSWLDQAITQSDNASAFQRSVGHVPGNQYFNNPNSFRNW